MYLGQISDPSGSSFSTRILVLLCASSPVPCMCVLHWISGLSGSCKLRLGRISGPSGSSFSTWILVLLCGSSPVSCMCVLHRIFGLSSSYALCEPSGCDDIHSIPESMPDPYGSIHPDPAPLLHFQAELGILESSGSSDPSGILVWLFCLILYRILVLI